MIAPYFSIIIPVYNVAPYLRQCLDSVLAQTFSNWEAICVDDGSTDGSAAILDEYAGRDKRFRVIHQKNAGVSVARNAGLDAATGEWIAFVDGDDTWDVDLLALLVGRKENYPICDIVCYRCVCVDMKNNVVSRHPRNCTESFVSGDDVLFESRGRYSSFVWGCWDKIVRKSFLDEVNIRFKTGMRRGEDTLFAHLLLAQTDNVLLLPDVDGYRYLIRNGSAVHVKNEKIPEDPFCLFTELYVIWKKTRRCGLKKRLQHIAAAAPTLACGDDYEAHVRGLAINFLLEDSVFNGTILPFMLWHGSLKSRLFTIVYLALPRKIRRIVLERLGGV